ncbi:MAG TPA: 23S rRNA (cytidine(2498)-2'-O)-methyltransferase RlmM [Casimicrobiaceae bacterium]
MKRSIVAHCRSGFEAECVSDLLRIGSRAHIELACDAVAGGALVIGACGALDKTRWESALAATRPWFARSIFVGDGPHTLPERDRITPLLAIATEHEPPFRALWLETPDTNEGKTRSGLCRRLSAPLSVAADRAGLLMPDDPRGLRLHVVFVDAAHAWIGTSRAATGSAWPMGIPRLALPHSAPSRSTLKLAEALLTFLTESERLRLLKPGMRAVDLGAAPGGWTWQLVQRGLSVTAIDNGLLRGEIARDPLVEHLRADGLTWRPQRPVDWMVCDIVLQPSRIAALVAAWVADGACRRTIFNLKLPMKKRYAEVERCAGLIGDALSRRRLRYTLRFKQLYHDREEITGYCARLDS